VRIISRAMRWVGLVVLAGQKRNIYTGFWWGNLREITLKI